MSNTFTDNQSVAASNSSSSTSDSSSSINAASQAVQSYYDDINARNYQAAYNLWYVGNQQAQTYDEFVAGYAQTVRDDITIKNAQVLSDGTVQLNVSLASQSTTGSETYQGYYIVGQRDGEWKLLQGKLQ